MKFQLSVWTKRGDKFTCVSDTEISVSDYADLSAVMHKLGEKYGKPGPRFKPIPGTHIVSVFGVHDEFLAQVQANEKVKVRDATPHTRTAG